VKGGIDDGFSKARDSNLYNEEKGEGLPILLTHPAAFRETAHRRWRRQASTLARAVHAGRVRAKPDPRRHVAPVDVDPGRAVVYRSIRHPRRGSPIDITDPQARSGPNSGCARPAPTSTSPGPWC
jgi:hypothetical protein